MFPTIIFELNENEIHFPSFIQPPNKNTLPINISEAEENEMYIPSFHLSPNENVCVWRLHLSPTRLENVPRPFTLSPNESINVSDECSWDQIERNICPVLSLYLYNKNLIFQLCLRLKSDIYFFFFTGFKLSGGTRFPGDHRQHTWLFFLENVLALERAFWCMGLKLEPPKPEVRFCYTCV